MIKIVVKNNTCYFTLFCDWCGKHAHPNREVSTEWIIHYEDECACYYTVCPSCLSPAEELWKDLTSYDDNWNYFKKYLPPYVSFPPQVRPSPDIYDNPYYLSEVRELLDLPHPDYNKVIGSRNSIKERGCPLVRDLCHLAAQPDWTDDESLFKDPAFVRAFTGCKKKA